MSPETVQNFYSWIQVLQIQRIFVGPGAETQLYGIVIVGSRCCKSNVNIVGSGAENPAVRYCYSRIQELKIQRVLRVQELKPSCTVWRHCICSDSGVCPTDYSIQGQGLSRESRN